MGAVRSELGAGGAWAASPRSGQKDLASDYASAELRRAVARYQEIAAQTVRATLADRPLREALASLAGLRDERLRLVLARRSVSRAAGKVYADPAKALQGLLRDPAAPERLRQGDARIYGDLRGRAGLLRPHPDRAAALRGVASLTGRLDAYRRSVERLHAARHAARVALGAPRLEHRSQAEAGARSRPHRAPSPRPIRLRRPAQIQRELARVTAALHTYQQASRGAQNAIETAIRGMGRVSLNTALLLLPPKVAIPVGIAVRAVTRVLDRGLDLGLGR